MSDGPVGNPDRSLADLTDQVAAVEAGFLREYGALPRWIAAAPGRVNLIGEHTDYNDGYVLPLAIPWYAVVAGRQREPADGAVAVRSHQLDRRAEFDLGRLEPERRDWTSYLRGVVGGFQQRGLEPGGLNLLIDSNVPLGSGLSSSAALEVATATLLEAVVDHRLDPIEKARLCQQAEHEYAGMPCGIMDQFSSVLGEAGKLLLIDCRSETADLVPLDDSDVSVLVMNSNVRHALTDGAYAERRSQCAAAARALRVASLRDVTIQMLESRADELEPTLYRQARHVVTENARTLEAADAVRRGDWSHLGDLMYRSHYSLRDDYQVSCLELDVLVDAARQIGAAGGVIGARMTGGGFGGCTVTLAVASNVRAIATQIGAIYQQTTGKQATPYITRPAHGARLLKPGA